MDDNELLNEQRRYYGQRAGEYDEWFFRQGRYDRGAAHRDQWFRELTVVETALRAAVPSGKILELACGTGLWTRHLVGDARDVIAVDASREVIAINQRRVAPATVRYVVADIFSWSPPAGAFDAVVFAFWLSHVPESKFEEFMERVAAALKPGGIVFFVDSLRDQESTAVDHEELSTSGVVERRLNDGRTFHIVKRFHTPSELEQSLARLGWRGWIRGTDRFFLYGCLQRSA